MNCIGNYAHWIKDEWIDYLKNNTGSQLPKEYTDDNRNTDGALAPFTDTEWDPMCVCCIRYESNDFPFTVELPISHEGYKHEYWFIKFPCGMGQPIHQDYNKEGNSVDIKRYWMPLQDYERGHIFIYKDILITGYKKGDLYLYDDPDAWHTAGNFGLHTRLSLNMTYWKSI
jgi:hypothetical protein